jgi:hypothetical protein
MEKVPKVNHIIYFFVIQGCKLSVSKDNFAKNNFRAVLNMQYPPCKYPAHYMDLLLESILQKEELTACFSRLPALYLLFSKAANP